MASEVFCWESRRKRRRISENVDIVLTRIVDCNLWQAAAFLRTLAALNFLYSNNNKMPDIKFILACKYTMTVSSDFFSRLPIYFCMKTNHIYFEYISYVGIRTKIVAIFGTAYARQLAILIFIRMISIHLTHIINVSVRVY